MVHHVKLVPILRIILSLRAYRDHPHCTIIPPQGNVSFAEILYHPPLWFCYCKDINNPMHWLCLSAAQCQCVNQEQLSLSVMGRRNTCHICHPARWWRREKCIQPRWSLTFQEKSIIHLDPPIDQYLILRNSYSIDVLQHCTFSVLSIGPLACPKGWCSSALAMPRRLNAFLSSSPSGWYKTIHDRLSFCQQLMIAPDWRTDHCAIGTQNQCIELLISIPAPSAFQYLCIWRCGYMHIPHSLLEGTGYVVPISQGWQHGIIIYYCNSDLHKWCTGQGGNGWAW